MLIDGVDLIAQRNLSIHLVAVWSAGNNIATAAAAAERQLLPVVDLHSTGLISHGAVLCPTCSALVYRRQTYLSFPLPLHPLPSLPLSLSPCGRYAPTCLHCCAIIRLRCFCCSYSPPSLFLQMRRPLLRSALLYFVAMFALDNPASLASDQQLQMLRRQLEGEKNSCEPKR